MQCELALRYARGTGVPQNFAIAAQYFERAADHGSATAQWKIGLLYLNGLGTTTDPVLGAKWIQRAANQGKATAQLALSQLYLQGVGVPRDLTRSYTWANIAAEKMEPGHAPDLDLIRSQLSAQQIADSRKRIAWWEQASQARSGRSASAGTSAESNQPR
jgi:TPR repeat protein